jgi:hypothetical protein
LASLRIHARARRGVLAAETFTTLELHMVAGLLALMLVSADTTTRIAPLAEDTFVVTSVAVAIPSIDTASNSITSATTPFAGTTPTHTNADLRLRWSGPDTTVRKKRKLVEYSEWYGRRLTIHRTLSWAMLPLFAISYYTGERLARDGRINSPYWVRAAHPYVATADSFVFGVNTVTGLWNLWDARHDPEGRTRRIIHSALFMVADAGFAYAGSIGEKARDNGDIRARHRTIALSSMGVSTLGWLIMLIGK